MDKIIGIGNALVDVIVNIDNDNLFEPFGLQKGTMHLIDENKFKKIQSLFKQMKTYQSNGGSAGNAIRALAKLGAPTGFIGKVGDDEFGRFFRHSLDSNGTSAKLTVTTDVPTGVASTFISKDGERTFGTFLGAASLLTEDCITREMLLGYNYLYIEGYLVQSHPMILHAMELAKSMNIKVCMDLSSSNIVAGDLEFFRRLIHDYVDIVFANEQEAQAYTNQGVEASLEELGSYCDIAVVKVGAKGSFVRHNNTTTAIEPVLVPNAIDTNAAGDYYAAGFMYGLLNGRTLHECGRIGSILSAHVIQVIGTTLEDAEWQIIKKEIK